jgi:two-component system OmpR family response regulator
MRILVIEDDDKIASFVVNGLRQAGMVVDHASNGPDGLDLLIDRSYDAAIVDVMLPGLDGVALIQKARNRKVSTPVIVLSAKRSVDDRISGLQSGADDYLTKPFAFSELLARVHALVRRASGKPETVRLAVGDLTLDMLARQV